MNEYSVSDYGIFNNAVGTINVFNQSMDTINDAISDSKNILDNESVFMGPICDSCMEGFTNVCDNFTTLKDNFSKIGEYLKETSSAYKAADTTASKVVLSTTSTTIDTGKKYGIATDGGDYTENNSYTNTKNGITYKLYDQGMGEWANYQYTDGKNMSYRGCMLTAAATVSSSSDSGITPGNLFNNHRHDFVSSSVPDESGGNLTSTPLSINNNTNQTIINNLQEGNPAIIMVNGSSKFTSSQHYMALLDITEDGSQIFIGNSHVNDGGNYSSSGWYPTNEVLTSVQEATIYTPSQDLVEKFN